MYNEAAAHMALRGEPKAGGPKTPSAVANKWKAVRKVCEYLRQVKQKAYPGASGWTYTDELGFNVTDETRDAWNNFAKAHPHFKPFATCGWAHFQTVDDIVPSRARGRYVFNAASSQPADITLTLSSQSQNEEDTSGLSQLSDASQPFTDWSQSNAGDSQPSSLTSAASQAPNPPRVHSRLPLKAL
ncbi:hypothetical protein B0H13DRAFT_2311635 [Mycena leptocephala]|nr:hypothetical protein B0H13DRAFT_2311635 [Mycena leptocephala]